MNTALILFLILILFYVYIYLLNVLHYENFMIYWSGPPVSSMPSMSDADNFPNWPFWNTRFGQTSNMSYDLRGDPLIIPKTPFMWNNSTLTPIYNKGLC